MSSCVATDRIVPMHGPTIDVSAISGIENTEPREFMALLNSVDLTQPEVIHGSVTVLGDGTVLLEFRDIEIETRYDFAASQFTMTSAAGAIPIAPKSENVFFAATTVDGVDDLCRCSLRANGSISILVYISSEGMLRGYVRATTVSFAL